MMDNVCFCDDEGKLSDHMLCSWLFSAVCIFQIVYSPTENRACFYDK